MCASPSPFAHIPLGVADYFWQEAAELRGLEGLLTETFRRWGYGDVIPPMFEYADVLAARANAELRQELVRFLDRDGSTLALRADMTIAVARLVATRLHDWPMPQRFCYSGSVFRYIETQAARQREFRQAGIELIGAASPAADAEVLALVASALRAGGLHDFRLVVGQLRYFDGLLQELALGPEERAAFQRAVDRNSEAELAAFLRQTPLRTQQRRTVEELPQLSGPRADSILDRAERLCLNRTMYEALRNLRAICEHLDAHGVTERLFLDLTEINTLGYYTGITFEALAPGVGFPIASGGRYDSLVASFGQPQPAVGAALGIDRILLARRTARPERTIARPVPPHAVIAGELSPPCLAVVERWRQEGLRIAVSLDEQGVDPPAAAGRAGARFALHWMGDGFDVYDVGAGAHQPTRLPAADWRQLLNWTDRHATPG